jgi:hypothetical protein
MPSGKKSVSAALPFIGLLPKAGPTHCELYIALITFIPHGIISEMPMVVVLAWGLISSY